MSSTGLRERKRARTRREIARAAVELCARHGFGATTVDAIAERAEVSKRTFFRIFATKEDAIVAQESDLFDMVLELLAGQPRTGTVPELFCAATAEATTRFDTDWFAQFTVAARILDDVASVEAAGQKVCARTVDSLRDLFAPGDPASQEHVIDLALESAVAAWRLARRDWLARGAPDPARLRELLHRNVSALPAALDLTGTTGPA